MPLRDFEKKLAPPYVKRNFINYEPGEGNKLFINSKRVLSIKTTQDLKSVVQSTATIINTVITNLTDFVAGRTNPSKYFKWSKEFVEKILDEEKKNMTPKLPCTICGNEINGDPLMLGKDAYHPKCYADSLNS